MQERVRKNTCEKLNREVDQKIKENIEPYYSHNEMINKRMRQLEKKTGILIERWK